MSDYEPPHRKSRYPMPEVAPVLAQARQRRLTYLEAMGKVNSGGSLSEPDRIESQDALQSEVDISEDQE